MLVLFLAQAWAYESEPADLLFLDSYDLLDDVGYDSGWVPSGSPVQVRIYLESEGGLDTEMAAVSDVSWPAALAHRLEGVPGTGWFSMITELVLGADAGFDLYGYKASTTVWSQRLRIAAESAFDPLLLPSGTPTRVDVTGDGGGIDPVSYEFAIFSGVSLQFELNAWPRAEASLAGVRVETSGPDTESWIENAGQAGHFDVPQDAPGHLPLASEYVGAMTANLDFVFQPSVGVCIVVIGCIDVATFELPVTLLAAAEERRFSPVSADHPLPVLHVGVANHDFGALETGDLANLEMPLGNDGELDVEGTAWIEGGDGAFTVFPAYFQAAPDSVDGVMVTWAPSADGAQSAVLVLESNDPSRPHIEIPLLGKALSPPSPDTGGGGESLPVKVCGCAAGGLPTGGPALVALLALAGLRRRRR